MLVLHLAPVEALFLHVAEQFELFVSHNIGTARANILLLFFCCSVGFVPKHSVKRACHDNFVVIHISPKF